MMYVDLFGIFPFPPQGPVVAGEEGEEHVAAEEEEEVIHKYEPPISKPWVSLGSEEAVQYESLRNNRPLVSSLSLYFKGPYV